MRDITYLEAEIAVPVDGVLRADPISLDSTFIKGDIESMNNAKDSNSLINLARITTETTLTLGVKHPVHVHAIARDLGILIGSIARLDINPIETVPGLESVLQRIRDYRGMSPYHTVFDYALWDPSDERRRTFTKSEQEIVFIEQVNLGLLSLFEVNAILKNIDLESSDAASKIEQAVIKFQPMIRAIPEVMRRVGAKFFAETMRPFFNPITLDGVVYEGPGGAQMPIILTDQIIWAGKEIPTFYADFVKRNLAYLPVVLKNQIESNLQIPFVEQISSLDSKAPLRLAVNKFLTALISFRKPHEKLARDSFGHRQEAAVGSGGYTPDLLAELINLTNKNRERKQNG